MPGVSRQLVLGSRASLAPHDLGRGAAQAGLPVDSIPQDRDVSGLVRCHRVQRRDPAENGRQVFRAASPPRLLRTAALSRQYFDAFRQQERANPGWTAHLVRRQGHEVGTEYRHVDRNAAQRLGGIDVQPGAVAVGDRRRLGDGLDHAGLVVGQHH